MKQILFFSVYHMVGYWGLEVSEPVNGGQISIPPLPLHLLPFICLPFKKGITDEQLGPLTMAPWDPRHVAYWDLHSHFTKGEPQTAGTDKGIKQKYK